MPLCSYFQRHGILAPWRRNKKPWGLRMSARLLPLLIPLAVIGSNLAMAGPAENALCDAYASAAITTVQLAIRQGCVQADNGRWDLSSDDHRNACLAWSTDPRNGGMNAMNETFWRGQQLSQCLAQKAGVPSPLNFSGIGPFTPDNVPNLDDFCRGYAFTAGQQTASHTNVQGDRVIASVQLCGFSGPRYDGDFDHQRLTCLGWGAQSGRSAGETSANETNGRTQDIIACEVRNTATTTPVTPPPTTAVTATVTKAVTMYNACQGQDLCYLNPGDTLTVDPAPNCGDSKWTQLTGTSGQCNGKTGFVYNEGDLSIP
jgi:hypothetical protein